MKESPKHIKIKDFNYPLPQERIAKYPLKSRDQSKLLVYNKGIIEEDQFENIGSYLSAGDLVIFNNTRVIQARLHFKKDTGAVIEVFCLEPYMPSDYNLSFQQTSRCAWLCMLGNSKRWKSGPLTRTITIGDKAIELTALRGEVVSTSNVVEFSWNDSSVTFADIYLLLCLEI